MRRLLLASAAAFLVACEANTEMQDSPVTTYGEATSISAMDIGELSPAGMVERLAHDLTTLSEQIALPRDAGELESDLMRVEEVGTDYRTIALRVERGVQAGEDAFVEAFEAGEAELLAAHAVLHERRDALIAAYPDMEREVLETFDKFDFGLIQDRSAVPADR